MNKWNRLLAALDHVYGFNDKKKSTIRKVSQTFDERTNEHVIMLEYRVRYRRLHFLRGWSYEQDDEIFTGSSRTGGPAGV